MSAVGCKRKPCDGLDGRFDLRLRLCIMIVRSERCTYFDP